MAASQGHHLLALLVSVALAAAADVASDQRQGMFTPIDLVPAVPGTSLAERTRDDRYRHARITSFIRASRGGGQRCAAAEVSIPLWSGAYTGTGQFFARLRVGTPAQEFLLVADTGSELTWVKCRGLRGSGSGGRASAPKGENVFRPDSKTWAPIPCSTDTCKLDVPFSLAKCSTPASPCAYDYKYKESSASVRGVVDTESATLAVTGGGKTTTLENVVLGCTTSDVGGQSLASADGVLGLGNSNISFATRAAARFGGGRFSYCLVDHLAPRNVTGYIAFGPGPTRPPPRSQTTPLLLDPPMPLYTVTVQAIHVAGVALNIPGEVWDSTKDGGVILDSGTTLSLLASPAYKAVVAALSKLLSGVPRASLDPFEYCYNWTASGATKIPKLAVQFAGPAMFEPPAKSYLIDAAPGVKCIGVQEGPWPGPSVLGNILQQEHLWEFDLKNRWVRFVQSRCAR